MPPPPSAAVPGAPRLPASLAAAAALCAAPTPPAPPHVALTPALLSPPARGTDRPPAPDAETNGRWVARVQAHSAAGGVSCQVHWRETCGAGPWPRPPSGGLARGPHPRGTHPPSNKQGGGGADTRRLRAGLGRAAGGGSPSPRCGSEPNPGGTEPLGFLRRPCVRGGEGSPGGLRVPTRAGRSLTAPGKGAKWTSQVLIGSDLIRLQPKPPTLHGQPWQGARLSWNCGYIAFPLASSGQPGERPLMPAPSSLSRIHSPPRHPPMCPGPPKLRLVGSR